MRQRLADFQWWYWALVPCLAILAYLPALGVGFLSDDYGFLYRAEVRDLRGYWGPNIFLPSQGAGVAFYRPLGLIITWQLGWQAWGLNPFPYHLLGLLLHAATSLVLGLWVSDLTGKRSAGLLAGAFFAVFPLHLEAVGWLSAQWDIWAAFFAITSLWLFNKWWRQTEASDPDQPTSRGRTWPLYALALLSYSLAVFSKESALTWIAVLGLVPLFSMVHNRHLALRRAIFALLPFVAALLIYLSIRFVSLGRFGGYTFADNTLAAFLVHALGDTAALLAPINATVLGGPVRVGVGVFMGLALLAGLALYARYRLKAVIFCLAWLGLTLIPVLNLEVLPGDLQGNRLLYLPAAGFCALAMILLQAAIERARPQVRNVMLALTGVFLGLCAVTAWLQVSVWQTATAQADGIGQALARLIPPPDNNANSQTVMGWYLQDASDTYKGAQVMRNGLDDLYHFLTSAPVPVLTYTTGVESIPMGGGSQDTYAIRFAYDEAAARFYVAYAAGVVGMEPPPAQEGTEGLSWDFRTCEPDVVAQWRAENATVRCEPGRGLVLSAQNESPQLISHPLEQALSLERGSYLRLGVAARYAVPNSPEEAASGIISRFFWTSAGDTPEWSAEKSGSMIIANDGNAHGYRLVVPNLDAEQEITSLRYDPVGDGTGTVEIGWIRADVVR